MNFIAIWGAALSSFLAVIKVWELYRDRMRLTVSYSFSSQMGAGQEVLIYNPSKIPVMISYWELLWMKKRLWSSKINYGKYPDEGYCDITIPAHSKHILRFKNENDFSWGESEKEKGNIYIRLHVVGRHPLTKLVYDFNKI